jgi:hypothetical protein
LQASGTDGNSFNTNNAFYHPSSSSLHQRNNNQILERFLASIKSDVTREGVLSFIHTYMRFHHLYEGETQGQEQQDLLNDNNDNKNKSKKGTNSNNLIYR